MKARIGDGLPRVGYAARSRGRAQAAAGRTSADDDRSDTRSSRKAACSRACAIRTSSPSTAPSASTNRIGLWMEFVKGGRSSRSSSSGRCSAPAEAVEIGLELCRAVAAVHGAGLLHRDIKAHNVMLAEDGRVVLMDFGAGRELERRCDVGSGRHAALSRARGAAGAAGHVAERHLQPRRAALPPRTGSYPVRADRARDPPCARARRADRLSGPRGPMCRRSSRASSSVRSTRAGATLRECRCVGGGSRRR